MLSSDNDDFNQQDDSNNLKILQQRKEAPHDRMKENNKSGKVKILSQTLLKTANLTSRKEFLNKVLEDTNINIDKLVKKSPVTSTSSEKNDSVMKRKDKISNSQQCQSDNRNSESEVSDSNSGQGKFIRGLMKRKQEQGKNEVTSKFDDDGDELNNNLNTIDKKQGKKEELSDTDSSEVFERSIRKTQSKYITPSKTTETQNVRMKSKEMLSSSSDSETEQVDHDKKHVRNLEKQSSSLNNDSTLNITPNKKVINRENKKQLVRMKTKEKKQEILSDSSDSEAEQVDHGKKHIRNLEKGSSSLNSDSTLNITQNKNVTTRENEDRLVRPKAKEKKREILSDSCDSEAVHEDYGKKHIGNSKKQSSSFNNNHSSLNIAPNEKVTSRKHGKELVRAKEKKKEILSDSSDSEDEQVDRSKKRVGNSVKQTQNLGKPTKKVNTSLSSSSGSESDKKSMKAAKHSDKLSSERVTDNKKKSLNNKRKNSDTDTQKSDSSSYDSDSSDNKNDAKSAGTKQDIHRKSSSSDSESSGYNNKKPEVQNHSIRNKKVEIKSSKRNNSSSSSSSSDSDNETSTGKIEKPSKSKRKYSETNSSDESSNEPPNKKLKHTKELLESEKLLQSFCEDNNYKKVELKEENPLNGLNKHEEVYLVQMSKNIDPRCLLNQKISFDNPTKLKIDDETYVWDINGGKHDDVILINCGDLLHLKPKGIVSVQPHFKSKNASMEMLQPVEDNLDLPNNLKVRHPLFGISYEEQMKLDDEIMKKLDDIFVDINKRNRKKSKKKHKDVESMDKDKLEDDALNIINLLNQHESRKIEEDGSKPKKSKKKHKHGEDEIGIHSQSIISDTIPDVNKVKKKKKRDRTENLTQNLEEHADSKSKSEAFEEESEAGISFIASIIEESSKKKKDKREFIRTDEAKEIPSNDNLKKKRKDKKVKEETSEEQPPVHESINEVPNKKKHKKKKREESLSEGIQEETFMKALIHECEGLVKPQKKKKQDRHEEVAASEGIENFEGTGKKKIKNDLKIANSTMSSSSIGNAILQLDESAIPKAKKKKKKHRNSIDNFIDDLVKDVTSSEETVVTHKKKKDKKKHKHKGEFIA